MQHRVAWNGGYVAERASTASINGTAGAVGAIGITPTKLIAARKALVAARRDTHLSGLAVVCLRRRNGGRIASSQEPRRTRGRWHVAGELAVPIHGTLLVTAAPGVANRIAKPRVARLAAGDRSRARAIGAGVYDDAAGSALATGSTGSDLAARSSYAGIAGRGADVVGVADEAVRTETGIGASIGIRSDLRSKAAGARQERSQQQRADGQNVRRPHGLEPQPHAAAHQPRADPGGEADGVGGRRRYAVVVGRRR